MGNTLKPHIENAEKTGVFQYCDKGLNEFPNDIQRLAKVLRTLDLSKNKISILPSYINLFSSLKCLSINENRLGKLPNEIGQLKKLESLSLNGNRINALPEAFEKLKNLRNLSLTKNNFSSFPMVLCKLKLLDVVDLSKNKLTEISDSVTDLQASELNLNENQISYLSNDGLVGCPRLKILRLEENCLELKAISTEILKHTSISLLSLDGNLFEDKKLRDVEGYDDYMERFTAAKKKLC